MARVFISYARVDARDLAVRLHSSLGAQHATWLDTREIAGGVSWSVEIERSIDACDVLLALLSPGAHQSPICRGEHLRALRKAKRIIPVLATPDADRPLYFEAANYRDLSSSAAFEHGITAHSNAGYLKLVGARLCLVPRPIALAVWATALRSASTLFREHVLRQIHSLRLVLLRLGTADDFAAIDRAIGDVGRWWP